MTRRCISTRPDFRLFPLFLRPVFSIGLFLRYFNDLSCIWRAPTPCKSPVFAGAPKSRLAPDLHSVLKPGVAAPAFAALEPG
jgi:hypothetical protein